MTHLIRTATHSHFPAVRLNWLSNAGDFILRSYCGSELLCVRKGWKHFPGCATQLRSSFNELNRKKKNFFLLYVLLCVVFSGGTGIHDVRRYVEQMPSNHLWLSGTSSVHSKCCQRPLLCSDRISSITFSPGWQWWTAGGRGQDLERCLQVCLPLSHTHSHTCGFAAWRDSTQFLSNNQTHLVFIKCI